MCAARHGSCRPDGIAEDARFVLFGNAIARIDDTEVGVVVHPFHRYAYLFGIRELKMALPTDVEEHLFRCFSEMVSGQPGTLRHVSAPERIRPLRAVHFSSSAAASSAYDSRSSGVRHQPP